MRTSTGYTYHVKVRRLTSHRLYDANNNPWFSSIMEYRHLDDAKQGLKEYQARYEDVEGAVFKVKEITTITKEINERVI